MQGDVSTSVRLPNALCLFNRCRISPPKKLGNTKRCIEKISPQISLSNRDCLAPLTRRRPSVPLCSGHRTRDSVRSSPRSSTPKFLEPNLFNVIIQITEFPQVSALETFRFHTLCFLLPASRSYGPFSSMDCTTPAFLLPIHISQSRTGSRNKCELLRPPVNSISPRKVEWHRSRSRTRRHPQAVAQGEWSKASATDFDQRISSNTLPLCLIGMSNCGKSHWSLQLHSMRSFRLTCVDDKIEGAIKPELTALGYSGIDGLAAWMGFPTDERFSTNQDRYLQLEEAITASAPSGPGNTVLDTTGSVCYLSDKTLQRLRQDYLVIHLEASDDMLEVMTDNYFATPKPVVWGSVFNRHDSETPEQALRRCYPALLQERRKRYQAIAHVTVPAVKSLSRELNVDGFFALLKDQLRKRPLQAS